MAMFCLLLEAWCCGASVATLAPLGPECALSQSASSPLCEQKGPSHDAVERGGD